MSIDAIRAQQVGAVAQNVSSGTEETSLSAVSNAVSSAVSKAVTPAGPTVTEKTAAGKTYAFTPYYSDAGDKMVLVETRSVSGTSGTVSHMSLKQDQIEAYCSRKGIAVPDLSYN